MTTHKTTTKLSLGEFGANQVWFISIGIPTGHMIDLWYEDEVTGERIEMDPFDAESILPFEWTLEGTVNKSGEWCWDGEGEPQDWNRNTVTAIKAFKESE